MEEEKILIVKLGDHSVTLLHMFKPGAKELTILKETVLFNLHNEKKVKAYARNSLYFFDADQWFRRGLIWFTDWK